MFTPLISDILSVSLIENPDPKLESRESKDSDTELAN